MCINKENLKEDDVKKGENKKVKEVKYEEVEEKLIISDKNGDTEYIIDKKEK